MTDTERLIRVLVVEDDPDDFRLVQKSLELSLRPRFEVAHADTLATAMATLTTTEYDVVLIDLSLPDSRGMDTINDVACRWPGGPIVVLTGADDEATGFDAIRHGAQDYLTKNDLTPALLTRTLRYSIERHRHQFAVSETAQSNGDAVAQFCQTLRQPVAEVLMASSQLCDQMLVDGARDSELIERMRKSASRLVAALNRSTQA